MPEDVDWLYSASSMFGHDRRMSSSHPPELELAARDELAVIADADERARAYIQGIGKRRVFPSEKAIEALAAFAEPLPVRGHDPLSTIRLLDDVGSAAAVESNGPRYFGFVTGATLPVAAAADRLALAWDNSASSPDGTPAPAAIEKVAATWVLDVLDLPAASAVGFTTSAAAGTIAALSTARRALLARQGWDLDRAGTAGAPGVRVVASERAHVVVMKALRVLGFGLDNVEWAPVDENGRIDPGRLPALDDATILILQAGEVNTGEFDPFDELIDRAESVGAWVHIDGAFGLWARASKHRALTAGADRADSWCVDGHKWLNTPYDSAMVIARDARALSGALHSDAEYSMSASDSQEHLTLEFSRRARGIPIWAALRSLGREGVADLVEHSVELASIAADGLRDAGYIVLNRVVLNQVLVTTDDPQQTDRIIRAAQAGGATWFGPTLWQGQVAFRISIASWRTTRTDIEALVEILRGLRNA